MTTMRCPECSVDFGSQKTITAIQGLLFCNDCAKVKYSEQELQDLSEEVVPSDIGIEPAHDGLVCPYCHKNYTAAKWNENTLKLCDNRKMRRNYVPIEKNNLNKYYQCPGCKNNFSRTKIKGVKNNG